MDSEKTMKGFTASPSRSSSAHAPSTTLDEKKEAHHPVAKDQYQQDVLKIAQRTYPKELPPAMNTMLIHHIRVSGAYADARDEFAAISQPTALGWSEVHCLYKYLLSFELSHPDSKTGGHLTKYGDLHYFLTAVFFNWETGKEIRPQPVLPEQAFDDYAKDVGLLIRDLEPIVNKDGSLDTSGRRMWDQAYLAFKANQETLDWNLAIYAARKKVMEFHENGFKMYMRIPTHENIDIKNCWLVKHHLPDLAESLDHELDY
ncbi:uncharacterized protein FSUBG_1083 [Fusarium subglutinans]|uniref:Uncharacterized protein n=1 Tax=Gibberella subglutinans TaxID=42677 RepID=A0A8H5QDX4_GIBSU|nr:uncharacterized protein FSUBG_1083 [Fusarium subglutinans]KAF5612853.1 hypothetical protein FSUBG_1083 [Fusarium subglutinans]